MYMCSADPSPTYSVLGNNRLINTVYISIDTYCYNTGGSENGEIPRRVGL